MSLVKVRRNHQITLPHDLRVKLHIAEGDYVEVEEKKGLIVLRPVKVVPSDQAYFHTRQWQAGEAEADQDIAKGRLVGPFDNAKDALKALKKSRK